MWGRGGGGDKGVWCGGGEGGGVTECVIWGQVCVVLNKSVCVGGYIMCNMGHGLGGAK